MEGDERSEGTSSALKIILDALPDGILIVQEPNGQLKLVTIKDVVEIRLLPHSKDRPELATARLAKPVSEIPKQSKQDQGQMPVIEYDGKRLGGIAQS